MPLHPLALRMLLATILLADLLARVNLDMRNLIAQISMSVLGLPIALAARRALIHPGDIIALVT